MQKAVTLILISGFVFCLGFAGYKFLIAITHPIKYQNEITELSNKFNLSSELIASIVNVESGYNNNAISQKRAIGLMQIKVSTAEYLNDYYNLELLTIDEEYLKNPYNNIYFGCLYISYLMKKFENINTVLASYNAGETRVRIWLRDENYSTDGKILNNIPYEETKNYVKKVNNDLKFYSKIYK